jgi:hypothetical protein
MVRALAIASARPAKIHYSLLASKRASACAALPLATVDDPPVHRDNRAPFAGADPFGQSMPRLAREGVETLGAGMTTLATVRRRPHVTQGSHIGRATARATSSTATPTADAAPRRCCAASPRPRQ